MSALTLSSSGLTLINASHVFLCEPLVNPALELQGISRVHRIGQQKEVRDIRKEAFKANQFQPDLRMAIHNQWNC